MPQLILLILCIQGLESDISFVPAIFFPWVILLTFCSFMVVWMLGSWNGLLGLEFSVDGVWGLW